MPEPTLGLIMIVRNEIANLKQSLSPVAASFDEAVVVDTGSRDGSQEFCRQLGAIVVETSWSHDFAEARNISIKHAKADWLFWLDADNGVDAEQVGLLRRSLPDRSAIIRAQEVVVPGGQRLWQKRCFPNSPEVCFQGKVHEQLLHPTHWPLLDSGVEIRHWGYAEPAQVEAKGVYYKYLLQESLRTNPDDYYARFQLARCHWNLREKEEAERQLRLMLDDANARRGNPELWAHGHHLLADLLRQSGQNAGAMNTLNQILKHMPHHGPNHYVAGRQAYVCGDWDGALSHLQRYLELGSGKPVVDWNHEQASYLSHFFISRAWEAKGRFRKAAAAMSQAAQMPASNGAARVELARLLIDLGRKEEARRELELSLGRRPSDRRARELWKRLEAA